MLPFASNITLYLVAIDSVLSLYVLSSAKDINTLSTWHLTPASSRCPVEQETEEALLQSISLASVPTHPTWSK